MGRHLKCQKGLPEGKFRIPLVQKDTVLVANRIAGTGDGNVLIELANGRVSLISESLLDEDFDVFEHQNQSDLPIKFLAFEDAVKADWMSIQPAELHRMLNQDKFGLYLENSKKVHHEHEEVVTNTSSTLSSLRYYPEKRSYENLVHAIRNDVPTQLARGRLWNQGISLASLAFEIDTDLGLEIAEANLHMATRKSLVRAFMVYTELQFAANQHSKVNRILQNYEKWKIPDRKYSFLRDVLLEKVSTEDPWQMYQYYLLSGNYKKADAKLEHFKSLNADQKKLFREAQERLSRSRDPIFSLLSEKEKVVFLQHIERLKKKLAYCGRPVLEKYGSFELEELFIELDLLKDTYGNRSLEYSNLLLYILEQRGYDGPRFDSGDLLWAGIFIKEFYGPIRAASVFALTQKTGTINYTGTSHGKDATRAQFVTESSFYFVSCLEKDNFNQLHDHNLLPLAKEITWHSFQTGSRAKVGSAAHNYTSLATEMHRKMLHMTDEAEKVIEFYGDIQQNSQTTAEKNGAIMRQAEYLAFSEYKPEDALDLLSPLMDDMRDGYDKLFVFRVIARIGKKFHEVRGRVESIHVELMSSAEFDEKAETRLEQIYTLNPYLKK